MKISLGRYDSAEESYLAAKKSEDGRAAPVSGSSLGVDARERAEDNKKADSAMIGDRVAISEEARELQRAAAAENPQADEERDDNPYKDFAKDVEGLKGMFKDDSFAQSGVAAGGSDDDNGPGRVEQLRKMIGEAQKRLAKEQEALNQAVSKVQSAEDEFVKMAAQAEVDAAQQAVQSTNAEIQMLREQLQKAMKEQNALDTGGRVGMASAYGGHWQPSGQRIEVGAGGITSLK